MEGHGAQHDHAQLKKRLIAAFEDNSEQSAQRFGRLARHAVEVMSDEQLDAISAYFEAFIQNLDGDALGSMALGHPMLGCGCKRSHDDDVRDELARQLRNEREPDEQ